MRSALVLAALVSVAACSSTAATPPQAPTGAQVCARLKTDIANLHITPYGEYYDQKVIDQLSLDAHAAPATPNVQGPALILMGQAQAFHDDPIGGVYPGKDGMVDAVNSACASIAP